MTWKTIHAEDWTYLALKFDEALEFIQNARNGPPAAATDDGKEGKASPPKRTTKPRVLVHCTAAPRATRKSRSYDALKRCPDDPHVLCAVTKLFWLHKTATAGPHSSISRWMLSDLSQLPLLPVPEQPLNQAAGDRREGGAARPAVLSSGSDLRRAVAPFQEAGGIALSTEDLLKRVAASMTDPFCQTQLAVVELG